MEGLMDEALSQIIENANSRIAELLVEARGALRGEREFTVAEVRRLSVPVEKMAPIAAQSRELRVVHPEIAGQLDTYKSLLRDLQTTLQQIRVMLLSQQTTLNASQNHVTAVSLWVSALHQTR
jgi:hypothetical protein